MKKVLVVDDNKDNVFLIRFILQKSGYQVVEAFDGLEGVRLAIEEKPDLILMDIQLPDIDGLEATQRIRKSGANGNIPIIALTAFAMTGDRDKALSAGCTGYITKPINVKSFTSAIEKYLAETPPSNNGTGPEGGE
jgi:two-component system cell cycle response regulator DivK